MRKNKNCQTKKLNVIILQRLLDVVVAETLPRQIRDKFLLVWVTAAFFGDNFSELLQITAIRFGKDTINKYAINAFSSKLA